MYGSILETQYSAMNVHKFNKFGSVYSTKEQILYLQISLSLSNANFFVSEPAISMISQIKLGFCYGGSDFLIANVNVTRCTAPLFN